MFLQKVIVFRTFSLTRPRSPLCSARPFLRVVARGARGEGLARMGMCMAVCPKPTSTPPRTVPRAVATPARGEALPTRACASPSAPAFLADLAIALLEPEEENSSIDLTAACWCHGCGRLTDIPTSAVLPPPPPHPPHRRRLFATTSAPVSVTTAVLGGVVDVHTISDVFLELFQLGSRTGSQKTKIIFAPQIIGKVAC